MDNKNHYYDGIIYDKIIAPNQDVMFKIFKMLIPKGSVLLDVGTGTGRLPFTLAEHCEFITGLDLSLRNIKFAEKKRKSLEIKNIEFIHGSITDIEKITERRYDFAVSSYVIHEMPPTLRLEALQKMKNVSDKIIIGDYRVPVPKGLTGLSVKIVEFLAGPEHFKNFLNFVKTGGIKALAEQTGLKIEKTIKKLPFSDVTILR